MNVTDFLSNRARETPDAPALRTREGSLSFAVLDRAVSWQAQTWRSAGLMPGDRVALELRDQQQHLLGSLALARLGACQIAFDASDPVLQAAEQAQRSGVVATVAPPESSLLGDTPRIDPPPHALTVLANLPHTAFEPTQDGVLPFMILRSSGTTRGVSKLGLLTHAACEPRLQAHRFLLPEGPGCRFLSLIDLSFFGAKQRAYACLASGGCFVALSGEETIGEGVDLMSALAVNYLSATPVQVNRMLTVAKQDRHLLPELKALRLGSTMIPQALRQAIMTRITRNLFVAYGSNEVGTIAIAPPKLVRRVAGVVGFMVPGHRAWLSGPAGEPIAPPGPGRLLLKASGMIDRYIGDDDASEATFRDGWFDTGDLVEVTPDRALVHLGRADDVMILDGINIYPTEIEDLLSRHPAVSEAAAFPLPSKVHGKVPYAAVVVSKPVSEADLIAHCRAWIGPRAPRGISILPELPRNAMGKVVKGELAEQARRRLQAEAAVRAP